MDKNFAGFVKKSFPKEVRHRKAPTAREASPFGWSSMRGAIGIGIAAVAIFLFATQKELWQLVVAFVGTFATLSQQLSSANWLFKGDKGKD